MIIKKLFAVLITFCLLVSMAPMQAFAEDLCYLYPDSMDDSWRCVNISPAELYDYGNYGYFMARAGQEITVTPKDGYRIIGLEIWISDSDAPLPMETVGSGYRFIMPDTSADMFLTVEQIGDVVKEYTITVIPPVVNGQVSVSQSRAKPGDTFTVTTIPDDGCELAYLNVVTESGQLVPHNNGVYTMPAENVYIQAAFQASAVPAFKVTFDPNGGACSTSSVGVNASNKLNSLPTPTYDGHFFVGWFLSDNVTKVTTNTVFDQDMTVYAHWVSARHTTNPNENDYSSDIAADDQSVLEKTLTDSDLAANEDVVVWMEVNGLEEAVVPAADKTSITNMAGNDKVAAYMDISLFKRIGAGEKQKIHNTKGKLPITMQLPNELIPENAASDSFYVIYYHNGQAKKTDASLNVQTKYLTFYAYEFSTYSLVYKTRISPPKTGDESNLILWSVLAFTSLLGMTILLRKRKEA